MRTEYEKIGGNAECFDSTLYTFTGESYCDGWRGISLEECKAKCTNNEVPNSKCPRQHVRCSFVQHSSWGCHLADNTCEPKVSKNSYTLLRKQGLSINRMLNI